MIVVLAFVSRAAKYQYHMNAGRVTLCVRGIPSHPITVGLEEPTDSGIRFGRRLHWLGVRAPIVKISEFKELTALREAHIKPRRASWVMC